MKKKAVILINLGTPKSPRTKDVKKYLREFLNDPAVIDIPAFKRKLLVNGIIVPFRGPKSAKLYQKLWTDKGSPLQFYTEELSIKLQQTLKDKIKVYYAMRYQIPSIKEVFAKAITEGADNILVIPLFPQYASSTTGSVITKINELKKLYPNIKIDVTNQFYTNPNYIEAVVENSPNPRLYHHVLFSFHGVPERQVVNTHKKGNCETNNCTIQVNENNTNCYRASCYATARLIAKKLSLSTEQYTVAFQSRLGKDPWLQPYADKTIVNLAKNGVKKMLVFSPSFVADCLETIIEIDEEYRELFIENGGEKFDLVESLNANNKWVDAVCNIIGNRVNLIPS